MQNICRVHCFQCTECLVYEVLAVVIGEVLGANYTVHVRLHKLLHAGSRLDHLHFFFFKKYAHHYHHHAGTNLDKVNLGEALVIPRLLDIQDTDDVLVVKVSQQLHLSERSQTEHAMIKWRDLLDGNFLAGRLMECRADGLTQSASSGIP